MTEEEPMSEERLAEIRNRHELHVMDMTPARAAFDIHRLLAEVERLRAENVAMREIVEAVAANGDEVFARVTNEDGVDTDDVCVYCARSLWRDNDPEHPTHTADCPVTQARALLTHPAQKE